MSKRACSGQQGPKPQLVSWLHPTPRSRARARSSPSGRLGLCPLCPQPWCLLPRLPPAVGGLSPRPPGMPQERWEHSMWLVGEELPGQGLPPNICPFTRSPGSSSEAHPIPCFRAKLWEKANRKLT